MGKRAKQTSFEDYLRQMADESRPLSVASLYRLSNLNEDELALFEIAWPSLPGRRRREITRHLVDITESNFEVECEPVFWIGLNDSDSEVREAAVDGLWITENLRQVTPLLRLMLRDPAVNVRAVAAGSLARFVLMGELGNIPPAHKLVVQEMLNALRAVIANPSEAVEVRRRAVEALSYSGEDDVPDLIRAAYNSPDERMRVSAVCGMGRSADSRWKATVLQALGNPNPEMRYEAARAAGELEIRKAAPELAALLDDPDREVQEMAIWALGQIGGKQALQLLHKCYEEGDEALSEAAEDAIEEASLMHGVDLPLFMFDSSDEEDWDDLDLDADVELEQDSDDWLS